MQAMQGFTRALGRAVQPLPRRRATSRSDANPHKNIARGMMRMTARLNDELLPAIGGLAASRG